MRTLEQEKERKRNWARAHSESNTKRARQWQIDNRERTREIARTYYYKNRDLVVKNSMEYMAKRKKIDPAYALKISLRIRLSQVLRGAEKKGSAVDLLGCTGAELKIYLESKFVDGMNWKERALWHLDHIVPLSKFDLQNPEELAKACHYKNLQPLWSRDNLIKGNK